MKCFRSLPSCLLMTALGVAMWGYEIYIRLQWRRSHRTA